MTDRDRLEQLRRQTGAAAPPQQPTQRIAELIRLHTGRHWIGQHSLPRGGQPPSVWSDR